MHIKTVKLLQSYKVVDLACWLQTLAEASATDATQKQLVEIGIKLGCIERV